MRSWMRSRVLAFGLVVCGVIGVGLLSGCEKPPATPEAPSTGTTPAATSQPG